MEVGKNWKHCLRKGGRGAGKEGTLVRVSDRDVAKEMKDEGRPLHQSTGGRGEAQASFTGVKGRAGRGRGARQSEEGPTHTYQTE